MSKIEEIHNLWKKHEEKPFPLGHRKDLKPGVNLTVLDAEIGGYVYTFLDLKGKLGTRQKIALAQAVENLLEVKDKAYSKEGSEYIQELIEIGQLLLDNAQDIA